MPGGLPNPFGGGGGGGSTPQPGGIGTSTPGYNFNTSIDSNGNVTGGLNTGGSFGQDMYKTAFPQLYSQFGDMASQIGLAGSQYLKDIGYSTDGAPDPNAPFLSPLKAIENARQSALSDLSDSMARRGVLGSSFASDAMTRQGLAYDQLKADTQNRIAASVMASKFSTLDQQNKYIQQQHTLITQALDKEYRDWAAANGISGDFTKIQAGLSEFDQKLAADKAAGSGSFFGNALGMTNGGLGRMIGLGGGGGTPGMPGGGGGFGSWLSNLFGGGAGNMYPGAASSAGVSGADFMYGGGGAASTFPMAEGVAGGAGGAADAAGFLV